jgi:hypothetical protein
MATVHGTRPWTNGARVKQDEERGPAERQHVSYDCPHGHQVVVPFAAGTDIQVPERWSCPTHGAECVRPGVTEPAAQAKPAGGKPPRTPWQMLCERRTIPELEALLNEALSKLRAQRRRRPTGEQ